MTQGNLFDAEEPKVKTRPATTPGWVIDELVSKHGITRATALRWPANQAFAVLHRCRERKDPRVKIEKRAKELAGALTRAAASDDYSAETVSDMVAEALSMVDGARLAAIARCVAEQLTEQVKP